MTYDILADRYRKMLMVNWKEEFSGKCFPEDPAAFWPVVRTHKNALDEKCFEEHLVHTAHCL